MLNIENISKQYKTGELIQNALSDVSLSFRDNEFVSILGPSGSGKTTLLNIIGGLDRYDSGNLVINNVSTRDYKDRDWDSYRNHTIGFVFQSYNLIPHQSVLSNVELALTISGISKKERRARAIEALKEVGLEAHMHKKPNQMSGGQMQRVAIARALVNNPDILLADEPTGALDTETSVQVMKLLKQVANDRLVIMVTHNPELAEKYSTRIVHLKDGKIVGDTNPYNPDIEFSQAPVHKNLGKASMSVFTAFFLSLKNLLTKKGRTVLTAFAGSIGIIGIALILSVSSGFQGYVDKIQEDTLTSYPLTINKDSADSTAMLMSMIAPDDEKTTVEGKVTETQVVKDMFSKIGINDIVSFKKYLEENSQTVDGLVSHIENSYSITPLIYSKNDKKEIIRLNPGSLMSSITGGSGGMSGARMSIFNEMLDNPEILHSQYDVLAGRWPESYDEVILVLPDANSMSDMMVYSLGLRNPDELGEMISSLMKGEEVENDSEALEFTYDELMNIELKLIDASSIYKYNEKYKIYEDISDDKAFMQAAYKSAVTLKIVGIITQKENVNSASLSAGIGYTRKLTEYIINTAEKSEMVKKQLKNNDINVINNKSFDEKETGTGLDFKDMISVDKELLSSAFDGKVNENDIKKFTEDYMTQISASVTADTSKAQNDFISTLAELTKGLLNGYISENAKGGIAVIIINEVDGLVDDYLNKEESRTRLALLEAEYAIPQEAFKQMYSEMISGFLKQTIMMFNVGSSSQGSEENEAVSDVVKVESVEQAANNEEVSNASMMLTGAAVDEMVSTFIQQEAIVQASSSIAVKMTEASMQRNILSKVGEMTSGLMKSMASAFNIDEKKLAEAFKFNLDEDEVKRLMETMSSSGSIKNANTVLNDLGYQNLEEPTSISFYFKDFEAKEKFIELLNEYNERMEKEDEDKVIKYNDLTGLLMSSVKKIVDSVSYVLIAFVSISLVVSSIMIGIITYISVLERKKEIGILRAIGASKKNISSIFNAETFIVGLFAGILGIGITLLLLIPINAILNLVTQNMGINAILPIKSGFALVVLSVILTLIGGLIPSRQAAKKDPVLALRSE